MIEGLKVTVSGTELKTLCEGRAEHHRNRVQVYTDQLRSMEESQIENANFTGGDPKRAMNEKKNEHQNAASEMDFIAAHLVNDEQYLLEDRDLQKLGVITSGRYSY